MSLPPSAPTLMTDLEVKYIVAENARASGVELTSTGRNENEQWQIDMKLVCAVQDIRFQALLEATHRFSEDISEGVESGTCDPP